MFSKSKVIFLLALVVSDVFAGKEQAKVQVKNSSGKDMVSCGVVHKYSDDYTDSKKWEGELKSGHSYPADLTVSYNTGIFTTGRDWWILTCVFRDGKMIITDPNNFRDIIDTMETIAPTAIATVVGTVGAAASVIFTAGTTIVATTAGAAAVGAVVQSLISGGKTAGFKQHILRSEDAGRVTTIEVYDGGAKVRFSSPSGNSETVTKTTDLKNA